MDTFNPNQMPPMPAQVEKKSMGPLIAVVIILALIVIGGLFFLKERSEQEVYIPPTQQEVVGDPLISSLKAQGISDDLNSIETDLNATNVDNLDQGASAIQAELSAQ